MKILAVIGSPRKGNTYRAVQQIEEEMRASDDSVEFEYLLLKDVKLEPCRGCFLCVSKGEAFCPVRDEQQQIFEKMLSCDGVIFASPVYAGSITALLKNLFDRFSYVCHRPCFFGKHALLVVTSCGSRIPDTLKYMGTIIGSWGFSIDGKVGLMRHPAIENTAKVEKSMRKAGKDFYCAIRSGKSVPPSLGMLLQYRVMRMNALGSREHFPADHAYYKDKKDYYLDVRIGWVKNLFAKAAEKLIVAMMSKAA